jgi:hypothetical protein
MSRARETAEDQEFTLPARELAVRSREIFSAGEDDQEIDETDDDDDDLDDEEDEEDEDEEEEDDNEDDEADEGDEDEEDDPDTLDDETVGSRENDSTAFE